MDFQDQFRQENEFNIFWQAIPSFVNQLLQPTKFRSTNPKQRLRPRIKISAIDYAFLQPKIRQKIIHNDSMPSAHLKTTNHAYGPIWEADQFTNIKMIRQHQSNTIWPSANTSPMNSSEYKSKKRWKVEAKKFQRKQAEAS